MSVIFGWWRMLCSPLPHCCCVCRPLTSLVVVKESVFVASKIRWVSKRVKRLPGFGSGEVKKYTSC